MAFDLGVQYRGLASVEGLDVGFVLRNFGNAVKYDGRTGVAAEAVDGDRPLEYYKVMLPHLIFRLRLIWVYRTMLLVQI